MIRPRPAPPRALARAAAHAVALTAALALAGPAGATTGGPDGFGYTWADDAEPGVSYNYEYAPDWVELYDDDHVMVSIGFPFEFYGTAHNTVTITSNGLMHFEGADDGPHVNAPLPYQADRLIAPFWDDLNPDPWDTGATIWYGTEGSSPNRVFIVEWWGVAHYPLVGDATFEVKLYEADDSIEFHYDDVYFGDPDYDDGASATIGIADGLQGYALQISYDQPVLTDYTAVRFDVPSCADDDGDGHVDQACGGDDCNDGNADVHPGAGEHCDGLADNNCDGVDDPDEVDNDGDGVTECGGDCDDGHASVSPGALEVCGDGLDNDCDGAVDGDDPDCAGDDDDSGPADDDDDSHPDDDTGDDDDSHPDDDTGDDDDDSDDDDDIVLDDDDDDDDAGAKNTNPALGIECACRHAGPTSPATAGRPTAAFVALGLAVLLRRRGAANRR